MHPIIAAAIPPIGGIDLQWWQWLSGAILLLGLSPAPWITAMLRGKLLTLREHDEAMKEQEKSHALVLAEKDAAMARVIEEKNYWRSADGLDRERSDKMAEKLMTVTEEFGATTVHLIQSLGEAQDDKQ